MPYQDKDGNNLIPNGGGQYDNPHWSAQYNTATTNNERIVAGFHADFNMNKWIRVDYNLGNNVNTVSRREVTEISSRAAQGLGSLVTDDYRIEEIESNLILHSLQKYQMIFLSEVLLATIVTNAQKQENRSPVISL